VGLLTSRAAVRGSMAESTCQTPSPRSCSLHGSRAGSLLELYAARCQDLRLKLKRKCKVTAVLKGTMYVPKTINLPQQPLGFEFACQFSQRSLRSSKALLVGACFTCRSDFFSIFHTLSMIASSLWSGVNLISNKRMNT
jgi:hypothetical protein